MQIIVGIIIIIASIYIYEEKQFFLQERIAYGIRNFNPVTDFPVGGNSFGAPKTEKLSERGEITAVLSIRENILTVGHGEEILSKVE